MLLVEQLERRVLADRQALIARGIGENLPTRGVEQANLDSWLVEEPKPLERLSPAELEKLDELRALGVA